MKNSRKSQSSVEFMLIISFMLLFFIGFLTIYGNYYGEEQLKKYNDLTLELSTVIEAEMTMAKYVEDGYTRYFELPVKLKNQEYEIILINGSELGNKNYSHVEIGYTSPDIDLNNIVILLPPDINGEFRPGENNKITKTNDLICINYC